MKTKTRNGKLCPKCGRVTMANGDIRQNASPYYIEILRGNCCGPIFEWEDELPNGSIKVNIRITDVGVCCG